MSTIDTEEREQLSIEVCKIISRIIAHEGRKMKRRAAAK